MMTTTLKQIVCWQFYFYPSLIIWATYPNGYYVLMSARINPIPLHHLFILYLYMHFYSFLTFLLPFFFIPFRRPFLRFYFLSFLPSFLPPFFPSFQMCEVSVGSSAELEKMIELVFEKAINDTNFANLYAEMCVTLESRSRSWYVLFLNTHRVPPTQTISQHIISL